MKFIIDEQLPGSLARFFREKGHDVVHVNTLRSGLQMPDEAVSEISMSENRVVISKDSDFLNSFVLKRVPYKLLFLTTGNIKNSQLLALFEANHAVLLRELRHHHVVEMGQKTISVIY